MAHFLASLQRRLRWYVVRSEIINIKLIREKNVMNSFYDFCEKLHKEWLNREKSLQVFKEDFLIEYLPEPYITNKRKKSLRRKESKIFILNTNPGGGMPHQKHENIIQGKSIIKKNDSYSDTERKLGEYYKSEKFREDLGNNRSAFLRGTKSIDFCERLGYTFIQSVETIPFHSNKLSKKMKVINKLIKIPTYQEYHQSLSNLIKEDAVVLISSISSTEDISKKSILKSDWLKRQADLIDFSIPKCIVIPVSRSKKKKLISVAVAVFKNKYMVLTMGNNNFPDISNEIIQNIKRLQS